IPISHGSFALSYELLHDPERWLAELVAQRGLEAHVTILQPGESRSFLLPRKVEKPRPGVRVPAPVDDDPDLATPLPDPVPAADDDLDGDTDRVVRELGRADTAADGYDEDDDGGLTQPRSGRPREPGPGGGGRSASAPV